MSKLLWDQNFPVLRLEGSGSRTFLQGQTSADIQQAEEGDLRPACWLDATGRGQALLEIRMDATGADVLVLAGAVLRAVGSSPRCFGIFCALESGEFSLREAFSSVLSGFWRVLGRVGLETDPSKIVRGMCSSIDDKKCP